MNLQTPNEDRIAEIFNNSTIFITGGTGFIGKALIEKLLRATNPKKIYILIRPKRGKSPDERLREMFKNVLFQLLLEKNPKAVEKCQYIIGDVSAEELGITENDREMLENEVNFIFHSAATTRFDETIKSSVIMNTRGTKYMLELAEKCKHLKLFVHVSSAYVFPNEDIIKEKQYVPPASPHDVLSSINWISDDVDDVISKRHLGNVPNTYSFSKTLAEALVYEKMDKMPCLIIRPAVVIPSYREPFPGWFNNLQGPMGLFVGSGKGVIRSMYMDSKSYANFVPVDCTVDALMVSSWNYLVNKKEDNIINACIPLKDLKVTWEEIIELGKRVINEKVPFNGILWYPDGTMTKSRVLHKTIFVLFQLIPAVFIDLLLFLLGYKPILYNIQMRILKGGDLFEFYTNKAWNFETTKIETIREKLNEKEKQVYLLQAESIDLIDYLTKCILSCRRHILKETDDMLPAARRNMKIMFVLDRFVKIMFFVGLGYFLYKFLF